MNRLKVLIIFGVTVIIALLFFIVSTTLKQPGTPETGGEDLLPTPESSGQINKKDLYIVSIIPADTAQTYFPVQPIQITFTQPVSPSDLKYQVSPSSESFVVLGNTPNSLIISPTTFWNNGSTTITIMETTISGVGLKLKNPKTYILKTAAPTIPPNLEGAY